MAIKKSTKKQTKNKRTAGSRSNALKKTAKKKKSKRELAPKKKSAKKKPTPKKPEARKQTRSVRRTAGAKSAGAIKKRTRISQNFDRDEVALRERRSRTAGQSGDLQGLSDAESANSESVDELVAEGNAFEADVVAGVESADDAGEREVRTHEVPEDDVPGEYLDEE